MSTLLGFLPLLAEDGGTQTAPTGSPYNTLILFAFLFGLMYFLLWRPQRKREQQRQEMLSKLKVKDHVITAGGIHGKVVAIKDDEVTLLVDSRKDVQMKFVRGSISHVVGSEGGEAPPTELPEQR
jgi:preprotein translocase subunit YajC